MPDTGSVWQRRSRSLCGRCPHTRKTPSRRENEYSRLRERCDLIWPRCFSRKLRRRSIWGLTPPPVIYGEPLPLFDSNRGADPLRLLAGTPISTSISAGHGIEIRLRKKTPSGKCVEMRGVSLPPPISHHVHAQASGKIASRKIVCSCERVRRFLPAIFSVRHPHKSNSDKPPGDLEEATQRCPDCLPWRCRSEFPH
jgi:hypothetical protein